MPDMKIIHGKGPIVRTRKLATQVRCTIGQSLGLEQATSPL